MHTAAVSYYKKRWLAGVLRDAIEESRVVVVTGARQVGKSTMLRNEEPFENWRYVTLDDFDTLAQAQKEPAALWAGASRVVIDEVQKAPGILSAVKLTVDERRDVRFVLTGSANLLLMHKVGESLAGRALYLTLDPMALGEERGKPAPRLLGELLGGRLPKATRGDAEDPIPVMHRGFMPSLHEREGSVSIVRWWEGYTTTYLERDLRHLSQVESLPDFKRLMQALAFRMGQLINQTDIARDIGLTQPTVHRYINLLETTMLLARVQAYALSKTKRLVKSPKFYWLDPGLGSYLAGHYDTTALRTAREAGGIFESLVLLHLKAQAQLLTPRPQIYYWRTTTGKEVDFVVEQGRTLLPIEVKMTTTPSYADAANLRIFLKEYAGATHALLVHSGGDTFYLDERILAIPWTRLAGTDAD